jgi:putative membrane protein
MSDSNSSGLTTGTSRLKAGLILGALAGVALGIALVLYYGLSDVGDAFLTAGWQGIVAVSAVHIGSLLLCAYAWQVLVPGEPNGTFRACLWARFVRDGVGNVLPVFPAAGEVVAARELAHAGVPAGMAGASALVDLTTEMVSQLLFTLLGLVLLIFERPGSGHVWSVTAGLGLATLGLSGFVIAQRKGLLTFLEALPVRLGMTKPWATLPEAASIQAGVQAIYDRPGRVAASVAIHLAAWIAGAAEAWTALWFMGHPLSFSSILIIESLVFALRSVAFAVPWAAGVQEGGYVVLGALFGLSPDVALALSLLKRARELITGLPALVMWQGKEVRKLIARQWRPSDKT